MVIIMKYISKSVNDTIDFAKKLSAGFKGGEVITLNGRLGAGKTYFTKGIAKGLNITDTVVSPTFTLMQVYEGRLKLYHCDMYRIISEEELYETDFFEALNDKKGVVVIEWADNIKNVLPDNLIKVTFTRKENPDLREISIEGVEF